MILALKRGKSGREGLGWAGSKGCQGGYHQAMCRPAEASKEVSAGIFYHRPCYHSSPTTAPEGPELEGEQGCLPGDVVRRRRCHEYSRLQERSREDSHDHALLIHMRLSLTPSAHANFGCQGASTPRGRAMHEVSALEAAKQHQLVPGEQLYCEWPLMVIGRAISYHIGSSTAAAAAPQSPCATESDSETLK